MMVRGLRCSGLGTFFIIVAFHPSSDFSPVEEDASFVELKVSDDVA